MISSLTNLKNDYKVMDLKSLQSLFIATDLAFNSLPVLDPIWFRQKSFTFSKSFILQVIDVVDISLPLDQRKIGSFNSKKMTPKVLLSDGYTAVAALILSTIDFPVLSPRVKIVVPVGTISRYGIILLHQYSLIQPEPSPPVKCFFKTFQMSFQVIRTPWKIILLFSY